MTKKDDKDKGIALTTWLAELGACAEAVRWAKGKTVAEAWATCQRPDWLMWIASKLLPTERARAVANAASRRWSTDEIRACVSLQEFHMVKET